MTGWSVPGKTIAALAIVSGAFNACISEETPSKPPYLHVSAIEALAHKADVNRVSAEVPNHVGFISYGRTINDEFSARANYLTRQGELASEDLEGTVQGKKLDISLPQGHRMIADGDGFYHITTRDRAPVGSLSTTFSEREGDLHMTGEYCPIRGACKEVIGSWYADNYFTLAFIPSRGEEGKIVSGKMYNR